MSEDLIVLMPPASILSPFEDDNELSGAEDSFTVASQGFGSVTGITYTVPAHSDGNVKANIRYPSLTSVDIENLNNLIKGMLSATQYEKVEKYERIHASGKVKYFAFWSGGASASYEKTRREMTGFGLSEENIKTIVSAMSEVAKKMSNIQLDINILNRDNDYAVSGNLLIYTLAGTIKVGNEQHQYRVLSNRGTFGSRDRTAPANVDTIPLD
jgi:hypothetical protein